jgi:hypothetical protein
MATSKALVIQSGVYKQIPDADTLGAGSGVTATGNNNLTLSPGGTGTQVIVATGKNLASDTVAYLDGGIDRSAPAALDIGNVNANAINIGAVGVTTTMLGDLTVNGIETVIGTSEFDDDAVFKGDVTFGDAAADAISFVGTVGPVANPNVTFVKELAHTIAVGLSTTGNAVGGALTVNSGAGNGTGAGGLFTVKAGTGGATGAGGQITVSGGTGGATSGAGGALSLVGGSAAAGGSNGGDASLDSGVGNGAGVAGTLSIGPTTALDIRIGNSNGATMIVNGASISLQYNSANQFVLGNGTLTVQAGTALGCTGTGYIDLPNNSAGSSVFFRIGGMAVTSANITAANFDKLFNGSNADALHTHSISQVGITATAGEAISQGAPVTMANSAGNPRAYMGEADVTVKMNVMGFAAAAIGNGNPGTIANVGELAIPDARWDAVPAVTDVGKLVYLSETNGKVTMTAPSTSGSIVIKVGVITMGGAGAVKLAVQIGDGVIL